MTPPETLLVTKTEDGYTSIDVSSVALRISTPDGSVIYQAGFVDAVLLALFAGSGVIVRAHHFAELDAGLTVELVGTETTTIVDHPRPADHLGLHRLAQRLMAKSPRAARLRVSSDSRFSGSAALPPHTAPPVSPAAPESLCGDPS